MAVLVPLVYDELRVIARRQLRRSRPGGTLDTSALVHEAFLKLSKGAQPDWNDRCHFFAVAASAMRQILVDYARGKSRLKRGGDRRRVTLDANVGAVYDEAETVLAIDRALTKLSELNPRLTRVVECRFFSGLTEAETAEALAVSDRTVRRDWTKARAWLHRELEASAGPAG